MHFSTLAAAAAFLAVGSAAPTATSERFVAPQVPKNVGYKTHPAVLMAKTYQKYGKEVPSNIERAAAASTGTVAANPTEYDSEYLEVVTVAGTNLNLDFDTGSSDLWVFSSLLPASERSGHNIYTVNSAHKISGRTWDISYGDGSGAQGTVYSETVTIGGVSVTSQAVEAATSISSEFVSDESDGLVGLAFPSINTCSPTLCPTFFQNAKAQLASPVFTADLKKGAVGSYEFGFIDSTKYTGAITYTSVNTANGFWEFTSSGYAVGSAAFTTSSADSIMDTGTTLLYAPTAWVKAYYAKVSGATNSASAGGYIFPCSATLPSLTVGIGSGRFVIPGSYMNYAPYSGSQCFGGLQVNTGIGFSIFGDIFIKSQFVIFNQGSTPQLGVAAKAT